MKERDNMENIQEYLNHIANDYDSWMPAINEHQIKMREEFRARISFQPWKKFIKIINGGSVHSFIVVGDQGKFKNGDILKAASWAAPAKNFKRGNILTKDWANVRWTGC